MESTYFFKGFSIMSRLTVAQDRGQNVVQSKGQSVLDPSMENKVQIFESRVSINWVALLSVGVVLVSFGFYLGQKISPRVDTAGIQDQQQRIIGLLTQQLEQQKSNFDQKGNQFAVIEMAKAELQKALTAQSIEPEKIIKEQREYIDALKQQVREMSALRIKPQGRYLSSVSSHEAVVTIPYNRKNESVLYYEHKLEREELNKKFEKEQKTFFEAYDMAKEENQEKFEALKKKHKLALYELEQEQYQMRSDFKKNNYRIKN